MSHSANRTLLIAASGVGAVALIEMPGLAGGFRLVKWAVLATTLALTAGSALLGASRPLPPRGINARPVVALGFAVASAILLPLGFTQFFVAHAGGSLRVATTFLLLLVTAAAWIHASQTAREQAVQILGACGGAIAVIVLFQCAGLLGWQGSAEFRAPGTMGNPNWAAGFLAPLPPLLLATAATRAERGDSTKSFRVLAAVIAVAVPATLSKGGVLALGAGVGVLLLVRRDAGRPAGRWLLPGAVATACMVAALLISAAGPASSVAASTGMRLHYVRVAGHMAYDHPLTGVGLGAFPAQWTAVAPRLRSASIPEPSTRIEFAYNDLLQTAAEGSLPSAVLLLVGAGVAIVGALRSASAMTRGAGAALVALGTFGLLDSPFEVPSTAALGAFLVAAALAPEEETQRRRGRLWTAVCCLAILLGALQALRFAGAVGCWTASRNGDASRLRLVSAAARLVPEAPYLRMALADELAHGHRECTALDEVAAALRAGFSYDWAYAHAELSERCRGPEVALAEWRSLATAFPTLVRPGYESARLLMQSGRTIEAVATLHDAVSRPPGTPMAEHWRRAAQVLLDRITGSKTDTKARE